MRVLVFDVETTGMINWRAGPGHLCQPNIVQLAMLLWDSEEDRELSMINVIVKPEKQIPEEVTAIHGISQETADTYGIPRRLAVSMFHHMTQRADLIVAHNIDFDDMMMRSEYAFEGIQYPALEKFCTMKTATEICKIPHANPNRGKNANYKWPKLIEAYKVLVDDAGFEGAHDALVDVRACVEVFKALQKLGIAPARVEPHTAVA